MERKTVLLIVALSLAVAFLVQFAAASVSQSDNTNIATPTAGTTSSTNITGLMQQYVGFYGTVTMQVRRTTGVASGTMYNRTATSGRIYWTRAGSTPQFPSTYNADNDSKADGNLSLSGYYVTGNHFVNNGTVCGYQNTNFINTSDNYSVGLLADTRNSTVEYFFCTNISSKTSGNGFGDIQYQMVVPKTSVYNAYDVWLDLG